MKITVIIPTWNSMPELWDTLASLPDAFGDAIEEVVIVDKGSTDATIDVAENFGCTVLHDNGTLGHARKTGLQYATTEWVAFIDSDITLPVDWLQGIQSFKEEAETDGFRPIGWLYGYTKEDIPFIERAHEWKRQLRNSLPRFLHQGDFERAYTNNTICLREPLLDAPIEGLNAWEDYVMGQWMIKKGYWVIEVPIPCGHLKHGVYEKFGNYTEAWGIAGELKAKGWNPKTLGRPLYFAYWGIRCTVHFKDLRYCQYYTGVCLSMYKAIFDCTHKAFSWSRNVPL